MKKYSVMLNVGKVKYLVNYYNGVYKYDDGSEFWDIATFTSTEKFNIFIESLKCKGYIEK